MTRTAGSSTSLTRAPISLPRVSDTQVPLISRENSSTSSLSAPSLNQSSGAHTPSTPAPAAMASSATGGSAQAAGSSSSGGSRPRGKLESLISYPPATTAQRFVSSPNSLPLVTIYLLTPSLCYTSQGILVGLWFKKGSPPRQGFLIRRPHLTPGSRPWLI